MDSEAFKVRIHFAELLGGLVGSKKQLGTCTSYCMKYYGFHKDLFDCILSELTDSKSSPAYLKHIMMLIESVISATLVNSWTGYRDSFEQSIKHVCHGIFHSKRQLDYHMDYIAKLLEIFCKRHWLKDSTIQYIQSYLQKYMESHEMILDEKSLEKSEFLERMEEERDQQKRFKELLWFRNPHADPMLEVDELLDHLSDWNSEDEKEVFRERRLFERSNTTPNRSIDKKHYR
jgi:hypothetical protein